MSKPAPLSVQIHKVKLALDSLNARMMELSNAVAATRDELMYEEFVNAGGDINEGSRRLGNVVAKQRAREA